MNFHQYILDVLGTSKLDIHECTQCHIEVLVIIMNEYFIWWISLVNVLWNVTFAQIITSNQNCNWTRINQSAIFEQSMSSSYNCMSSYYRSENKIIYIPIVNFQLNQSNLTDCATISISTGIFNNNHKRNWIRSRMFTINDSSLLKQEEK